MEIVVDCYNESERHSGISLRARSGREKLHHSEDV
jgi:hypothetical protein